MIEKINLSKDCVTGGEVRKVVLPVSGEIQELRVDPHTAIKLHGHNNQWEVWLWNNKAYVCLKGEEHQLINESEETAYVRGIKGKEDYLYDDLDEFFHMLGYAVYHDSLIIK